MKTIHEIKEEHGRNAATILHGYQDATQEIRAERKPEEGAYLERLTPEQRWGLLREQKAGRADDTYRQTLEAYTAEVERYGAEVAQRRGYLRERLFKVEDADALAKVALSSDEDLTKLMDRAALADNRELAKAVFMEATQRGAGDLMHRYLETFPEYRSLYAEWSELPTEEVLERQRENIERVVQPPDYDRLMPYAKATT